MGALTRRWHLQCLRQSSMPDALTAQSRFKIPIQDTRNMKCSIDKNLKTTDLLRLTALVVLYCIVLNKRSMVKSEASKAIDYSLNDTNGTDELFSEILTSASCYLSLDAVLLMELKMRAWNTPTR